MMRRQWAIALLCLSGCASLHPDHFYALEPKPAATAITQSAAATAVSLKITVPSLVDRNELVLRDGSAVTVLEHERWAAPLADQMTGVLGQDIEQRRPDLMISSRRPSQTDGPTLSIFAEIVEVSASRVGVSLEVRWRIDIAGSPAPMTGREMFRQAADGTDYVHMVRAVSDCLAQLADRLTQQLPPAKAASG